MPTLSPRQLGLYAAALVIALSVFFLNGQPLIYFDTASYADQGAKLFGTIKPPVANVAMDKTARSAGDGNAIETRPNEDKTVVGSRSVAYAIYLWVVTSVAGLTGVICANLAAISVSAWILAKRLVSVATEGAATTQLSATEVTAAGLLAACLGSLPFYVAFVMPDIFAPVLILLVAVLAVYGSSLGWIEWLLAVVLALFSVVSHPSHLLLVFLLAPFAVFVGPQMSGRRLTLGLMLVGALVGAGLAERYVFGKVVEHYLHKRVVYMPFLTARLIDDGPGLTYLEGHCPNPAYATCELYQTLTLSQDPTRFDAPNILFSRTDQRGSYQRLTGAEQTAVAEEQVRFLTDVVKNDPIGVVAAILRNVATQLVYFSVEMTVPTPEVIDATEKLTDQLPARLSEGRLISAQPPWAKQLFAAHGVVYLVSLCILGWLIARKRISRESRALLIILLGGIGANAIVCGAVSEPAYRYGARVMFLLPLAAMMMWLTRIPNAD